MLYKVTNSNYTSVMVKGEYMLHYEPGEIVKAPPDTLGLMLFKYPDQAFRFARLCSGRRNKCKVLTVEPLESISMPSEVSIYICADGLNEYYNKTKKDFSVCSQTSPPEGTVCCQSVRVLKELKHRRN